MTIKQIFYFVPTLLLTYCAVPQSADGDTAGTTLETENVITIIPGPVTYSNGTQAAQAEIHITESTDNGIMIVNETVAVLSKKSVSTTLETQTFKTDTDGLFPEITFDSTKNYFIELISGDETTKEKQWFLNTTLAELKDASSFKLTQFKKFKTLYEIENPFKSDIWIGIEGTNKFEKIDFSQPTVFEIPVGTFSVVIVTNPIEKDDTTEYTIVYKDTITIETPPDGSTEILIDEYNLNSEDFIVPGDMDPEEFKRAIEKLTNEKQLTDEQQKQVDIIKQQVNL